MCHLFTLLTVTTGGCLYQHTLLIAQTHGQTVKFEFCHVLHRCISVGQTEFFADACVKSLRAAGLGIGLRADTQHRHCMANRGKLRQGLATHTLCGRIWLLEFRVSGFHRLQLLKQLVIFSVRQRRFIQHVVAMGVQMQKLVQLFDALG